jgi:6-phosphogluconolactonase
VEILPDLEALHRAAADAFLRVAREATLQRGRFTVALSGGQTPRGLYEFLVNCPRARIGKLPWEKWEIFFGDERPVPPDHAESNFRMVQETLLANGRIPLAHVHRIQGELDPQQAADLYEADLMKFFGLTPGQPPRFDLILLGLGADGHTASLFPGTSALAEQRRWVCANWVPKLRSHRVTLTLPVLNAGGEVMFVVSGKEKAEVLRAVLQREDEGVKLPAQLVLPHSGRLLWLVDAAAASLL